MEENIGVFVCTGYGIAEALDIEALCKVATEEFKLPFCKTVDSCEGQGLLSIIEEIKASRLDKVLIAGISARRYKDAIFPEGVLVEKTKVGNFEAVIPEVTASAFITGFNQLVLDDRDPLGDGFFIGF